VPHSSTASHANTVAVRGHPLDCLLYRGEMGCCWLGAGVGDGSGGRISKSLNPGIPRLTTAPPSESNTPPCDGGETWRTNCANWPRPPFRTGRKTRFQRPRDSPGRCWNLPASFWRAGHPLGSADFSSRTKCSRLQLLRRVFEDSLFGDQPL